MTDADRLEAAALVLAIEGGEWWTQGCFARSSARYRIGFLDPEACCFCAEGAILAIGLSDEAREHVYAEAFRVLNDDVTCWNDAPGRTAREVASLMLDAADQLRGEAV